MNHLKEIKERGRYMGQEVIAIHRISNLAIIELSGGKNWAGANTFSIFVDGQPTSRGCDSLDHAILMGLAYKYSKQISKDVDAWRYAARVLQMEE